MRSGELGGEDKSIKQSRVSNRTRRMTKLFTLNSRENKVYCLCQQENCRWYIICNIRHKECLVYYHAKCVGLQWMTVAADAEHFSNCTDGKSYKCPICSIKQEPKENAEREQGVGDERSEEVNEPEEYEGHSQCVEMNDDADSKWKKVDQNDPCTRAVRKKKEYTRCKKPGEESGRKKEVHHMTTEWTEKRVPSTEAVAFTAGKTPKSFGVKQKPHTIHDFMNNCEDISDVTGSDESFEYSVDTCFSEAEDLSMDIKHDDKVMNEHNSLSSDNNEDMEFDDLEITSADCEYIENVTSAYCDTNKGDMTQNHAKPPVSYETISRMMDCPNLPRKAFFSRRYIPCEARFQLSDNEWNRIKPNIFQPNKLKPSWTNIMAQHMAKSNDFCTFRFKRHFVQKEGSRKRNNSFVFTASGFCIFEDCPCYFKLSMRKEHFFSKLITVEYQGSVKHATGDRHSRFIQND